MTNEESMLKGLIDNPVVRGWFRESFGQPTEVQRSAWPAIRNGQDVLIAAPTGSGKTLAAILPCLDRIVSHNWEEENDSDRDKDGAGRSNRNSGVRLLYVTPLKALNNDIHHHLFAFVGEMEAYAAKHGLHWPGIRVGIRTGDTSQSTRASMIKNPPDVLVTTPESLYLLLASEKARSMLQSVEQIIIDEIHQLAADKRGLHLSVTLERLTEWCGREAQRIGVSATIRPLERVSSFLTGFEEDGTPRESVIVESSMDKRFEISVTMPSSHRKQHKNDEESVWTPLLELLMERMEGSRSVLIFVNNRRLCERITLRLNDHVGYEMARSHHGSVSREKRLDVERALKSGELRCLVATATLELGIDVGHIDLVIQIDSPQSAAAGIQRIGRAGHSVGDVSRGVIVARVPGALAECALLARDIAARAIEDIRIPTGDWDVLAQQLAAMAAAGPMAADRAYALLRRSYGYRALSRARFEGVLQVLSGYYPFSKPLLDWARSSTEQEAAAKLNVARDTDDSQADWGSLMPRSNTKMAAILGAGTIPQSSAYPIYHHETRTQLGELDEVYIHESRVGDVFMLGTASWRIQSIQNDRVLVKESTNAFSEIPFWQGEGPGRTYDVSRRVGALLGELLDRLHDDSEAAAQAWLIRNFYLDESAAERLAANVSRQRSVCAVPTDKHIVIEQYKDDAGRVHLIIHSLFGRRLNRTWQLVLQRTFDQLLPYRFYSNAKENGIEFVFPEWDDSWVDLIRSVTSDRVEPLLRESIAGSPLFGATFRRLAETSLLLARGYGRTPLWVKRIRSESLLRDALPFADQFPLVQETLEICLEELLGTKQLIHTLEEIEKGTIHVSVHKNLAPSPYAFQFLAEYTNNQMYESDALAKDIQLQLMTINRDAAVRTFGTTALKQLVEQLDPEGSGEWATRAPRPEDEEELYRLLKQRGDSSEAELVKHVGGQASEWLENLRNSGRVIQITVHGQLRWICADEAPTYASFPEESQAVTFIMGRYVDQQLYVTATQLSERFGLSAPFVHALINKWAADRILEPSPFSDQEQDHTEPLWTSRKAAEQIIRLSAKQLRDHAEPVDPSRLIERILKLQLVQPITIEKGSDGLRLVIERLQGVFLPMTHWESFVFPSRLPDYRKETLDQLCAMGEVLWFGRKQEGEKEGRIAFFLTESKDLYRPYLTKSDPVSEDQQRLLEMMRRKGASFLTALSRDAGLTPSELLDKLLELVWGGYVSNDQFAPIRMHGQGRPSSAKSNSSNSSRKFQSGLGRWYLLDTLQEDREGVNPSSEVKEPPSSDASLTVWIQHLLNSYGLFTRDMLSERLDVPIEVLSEPIRRLESWGLLTRGLWVRGITPLQFSTPPEVEALRQASFQSRDQDEVVVLCAVDPANPYGTLVSWPESDGISYARKASNFLVLYQGRLCLWIEQNGKRFYEVNSFKPNNSAEQRAFLASSMSSIVRAIYRLGGIRKLVVDSWNGVPITASHAYSLFEQLGAEKDRASAVVWLSSLGLYSPVHNRVKE
ncbi:MAG: hypothetical protein K0Q81_776 [Paenibacillus sp.]|nr:hypothetical protein [Paenibacillus sp.]